MTRRRGLTPEDRALWQKVTSGTTKLKHQAKRATPNDDDRPAKRPTPPAPPFAEHLKREPQILRPEGSQLRGSTRIDLADHAPKTVGRPEPGLDRRTADKLRRGDRKPEARLDLHGMTADRAHSALNGFLARSILQSRRCVLVITGKGGRHQTDDAPFMRPDQGVLRQAVPRWLRSGPYARQIVGIFEAHPRHGGAGAIYVYLKKPGRPG
ncbi:Smr/MutS family protein [Rhodobacteraceae bacterium NNCM2]|nr:Smr/MutS family protein [Coraliihabitans acroporae]